MPPITDYASLADVSRYGVSHAAIAKIGATEIQAAITAASRLVDNYLRGADFTLPLEAIDESIREATAIIAAWTVVSTRGLKPGENLEDNVLYRRYKEKLDWLKMVADGKVVPNVTDSSTPTTDTVGAAKVLTNDQRGWSNYDHGQAGPFTGTRRGW